MGHYSIKNEVYNSYNGVWDHGRMISLFSKDYNGRNLIHMSTDENEMP